MKLKFFLPFLILQVIAIFLLVMDKYLSIKQKNISLNFIVTKIERTPTQRLKLYDGENELDLRNYTFAHYEDIKIGDSVVKTGNDDRLFFYRKNSENGKYEKNLVRYPG